MSRIVPNFDLSNYKEKLTAGEEHLVNYLNENLPTGFKIYLKTELRWAGLRKTPDIVIAHAEYGIVIIEVKDWKFKKETLKQYKKSKDAGDQVLMYKKMLIEGIPEIYEDIFKDRSKAKVIQSYVYFHNLTFAQGRSAVKSYNPNQYKIITKEDLLKDKIKKTFSLISEKNINFSDKDWFEKFENWIMPPLHNVEDGQFIQLNEKQKKYSIPSPKTTQKLSGVAGSGKTLTLAVRAANLAAQKKKVLFLCFNITLVHYIEKLIKRVRQKFELRDINIDYFTNFCRKYAFENDLPPLKKDGFDIFYNNVFKHRKSNLNYFDYDAVLIDEGQDFEKDWVNFAASFLSSNKEMIFAVDGKQNIYKRNLGWSVGRGRWGILEEGLRVPKKIANIANVFSDIYLNVSDKNENPHIHLPSHEQLNLLESKDLCFWREAKNESEIYETTYKVLKYFIDKYSIKISDTAILVYFNNQGIALRDYLYKKFKKEFTIQDIFDPDNLNQQKKKKMFRLNNRSLKMCTFHSFKGWEARNIILIIPNRKNIDNEIYTAITRTQQNLIIINQNKKYFGFNQNQKVKENFN